MKRRRPRVRASQAHIIDVLDRDPVVRDDHQRELLDRSHPGRPHLSTPSSLRQRSETARSGADCQRAAPSDPSPGTITTTGIDEHDRPEIAITVHWK